MMYDLTTSPGMGLRAIRVRKREAVLRQAFSNFHIYCQAVAEMFWPERANFTRDRTPGTDMQEDLFTGTPQLLRRDLANRIGNAIRPGNRDWIKLVARPEEFMEDDGTRLWCDTASRVHRRILYDRRANYSHTMSVGDNDYVCFGNAVSWCAYNAKRDGLVFRPVHLKDAVWATDESNIVNELYERISLSLDDCVRLFGKDRLPKEWIKMLDKPEGGLQKVTVIRGAYPIRAEDFETNRRPPKFMNYVVSYIVGDGKCSDSEDGCLGESYCATFPYNVRRWLPLDEPFGRSPCTTIAQSESRRLNVAEMATLKAIEWAVDGPMWAEEDAVVSAFELRSGGITFVNTENMANNRDPIGRIQGGEPRMGMEYTERKRADLAVQFYEVLWKLPEREMTAFETAERMELLVQEAAPVFQPMEADLSLQQDTVFSKAMNAPGGNPYDVGGSPPQALVEAGTLEWEFETFIATSIRKMRSARAQDVIRHVAEAKAVKPDYGDHINWDEMERDALAGFGWDRWVLDRKKVDELRQIRANAQRQAQIEEDMARTAEVAANANPENLRMMEGMS